MKRDKLTQKQEDFCLNYIQTGNISEAARLAKYSPKTAGVIGRENLQKPQIIERLTQLRQKAEDALICDVIERKRILSEIARGNLLDYQEVGADGGYLNIGKESPNTRSIAEITSRTEYSQDKQGEAVVTKVRLHNPVTAIQELNKMDGVYTQESNTTITNNINVIKIETATAELPFREVME